MSELREAYAELERISKSYIQKNAGEQITKADRSAAITAATQTPRGARLAKKIVQLERLEAVCPTPLTQAEVERDIRRYIKKNYGGI